MLDSNRVFISDEGATIILNSIYGDLYLFSQDTQNYFVLRNCDVVYIAPVAS
jgi:hypothetical protein